MKEIKIPVGKIFALGTIAQGIAACSLVGHALKPVCKEHPVLKMIGANFLGGIIMLAATNKADELWDDDSFDIVIGGKKKREPKPAAADRNVDFSNPFEDYMKSMQKEAADLHNDDLQHVDKQLEKLDEMVKAMTANAWNRAVPDKENHGKKVKSNDNLFEWAKVYKETSPQEINSCAEFIKSTRIGAKCGILSQRYADPRLLSDEDLTNIWNLI